MKNIITRNIIRIFAIVQLILIVFYGWLVYRMIMPHCVHDENTKICFRTREAMINFVSGETYISYGKEKYDLVPKNIGSFQKIGDWK